MSRFYELPVKQVRQETPDSISIEFDVPEEYKSTFQYLSGQYLTLKVDVNGEQVRRPYSLCSSPVVDDAPKVTSKRVDGGKVSNFLNDNLKTGDTLEVFPPMGKFTTEFNANNQRTFVMLGGGSGITPLYSLMKTALKEEPMSMVFLFYGNRDKQSIIFDKELKQLKAQYPERFKLVNVLESAPEDWPEETGLLKKQKILKLLDQYAISTEDNVEYYICGPQAMIDEAEKALSERGIEDDRINIEYFSTPIKDIEKAMEESGDADTNGQQQDFEEAEVTVILDGEEFTVNVSKHETILDALIEEDHDPPYACQMGICTTCMASLHEGNVQMYEDEGLSDAEKEEGYILTCQSTPTTPKVKIEYE